MNKEDILKILEGAKDKNGDVPMRLVRLAFKKLQEPCTDTISRQAVIDMLDDKLHRDEVGIYLIPNIKKIPPVQPEQKTGTWIKEDRGGVEYTAVCSECGYSTFWSDAEVFIYCPICGAKLERG